MIEYTMLIVILIAAFVAGRQYVLRGFAGRWKASADSFGFGMQYDPKKTVECIWSEDLGRWYVPQCHTNYSDQCAHNCMDHNNWNPCGSHSPNPNTACGHNADCCEEHCNEYCVTPCANPQCN